MTATYLGAGDTESVRAHGVDARNAAILRGGLYNKPSSGIDIAAVPREQGTIPGKAEAAEIK